MGPALPYLIIAWLVSLIAVGAGVWIKATSAEKAACEVRIGKLEQDSRDRQQAELGRAVVAATTLEGINAKKRIEYRTIRETVNQVVEKPVYQFFCLDDDGLRAARAALAGTGTVAAEPDPAVPATSTTR